MNKMSDVGQLCPIVVGAYLGDYSLKLSASEVSRKVDVERRTVSRILNKLVDFSLMNYEIQGKNKLFYFDLKKGSSFSLLNLAEINRSLNFELSKKNISLIVSKLLKFYEGVVVFGSYALSKERKDSDLDVVIFGKEDREVLNDIRASSMVEINEHCVSYSEFRKILKEKNPLAIEISRGHVIFGNFSGISRIFLEDKLNG